MNTTRTNMNNTNNVSNNAHYKCSFCLVNGHKINKCNSNLLNNFINSIKHKYIEYRLRYSNNPFAKEVFYNYLFYQPFTFINVASVSKAHCRLNDTLETKVERLVNYIDSLIINQYINSGANIQSFTRPTTGSLTLPNQNSTLTIDELLDLYPSYNNEPNYKSKIDLQLIDININDTKLCNKSECPICFDDNIEINNRVFTNCNHILCNNCVGNYLKSIPKNKKHNCPMCRTEISKLTFCNKTNFKNIQVYLSEYKDSNIFDENESQDISLIFNILDYV